MAKRKLKAGEKLALVITITITRDDFETGPEKFVQYTDYDLRAPFFDEKPKHQDNLLLNAMVGGTHDVKSLVESRAGLRKKAKRVAG